jgi:hypothetical protein
MSFDSKSTSFRPKSSEQMKNQHALKLYPENATRLNRTGPTNFFYEANDDASRIFFPIRYFCIKIKIKSKFYSKSVQNI